MPRIISDELFDSLMQCVKDQRLLGVMGLFERVAQESVPVQNGDLLYDIKRNLYLQSYIATEERK